MKGLLFLMIVCSICINVNTDEFGRVSIYAMEFSGAAQTLKDLQSDFFYLFSWITLLALHVVLFSMFFLSQKPYFQNLLVWIPIGFVVFFVFVNFFSIFLLIPFIGIWLTTLSYRIAKKKKIRVKLKFLLLGMFLGYLFAVFSGSNLSVAQLKNDLSTAFLEILSAKDLVVNILWIILMCSNIVLLSLFFLKKVKCFKQFLLWVPAVFISLFISFNYLAFFMLIPFILFWTAAFIKQEQEKYTYS